MLLYIYLWLVKILKFVFFTVTLSCTFWLKKNYNYLIKMKFEIKQVQGICQSFKMDFRTHVTIYSACESFSHPT